MISPGSVGGSNLLIHNPLLTVLDPNVDLELDMSNPDNSGLVVTFIGPL